MIANERQYRVTRNKARNLARTIEEFDTRPDEHTDVHARLTRAEREALESQLAELQEEMKEYEQLKSADLSVI